MSEQGIWQGAMRDMWRCDVAMRCGNAICIRCACEEGSENVVYKDPSMFSLLLSFFLTQRLVSKSVYSVTPADLVVGQYGLVGHPCNAPSPLETHDIFNYR